MSDEKEKKYTVYEIEKLTKGKLSKYKLTKAIESGLLKAEKVKRTKKGRGVPNFFVYESDLFEYLKYIEENKKKFIPVPEDDLSPQVEVEHSDQDQVLYLLESNKAQLAKQNELLERLQTQFEQLVDQHKQVLKNEESRSSNRRALIDELSKLESSNHMPSFQVKKREDILSDLIELS